MKFNIQIFGCQMNYTDWARIKSVLLNLWRESVQDIQSADIVIFTTCSVRAKAEDKITGKIKEISKTKKIRLTWCMPQHNFRNSKIQKLINPEFKANQLNQTGNFLFKSKGSLFLLWKENDFEKKIWQEVKIVPINHCFNPFFVNLEKKYKNLELVFRIDDTGLLPFILTEIWYNIKNFEVLENEYENIIPQPTNMINISNTKKQTKSAFVPISKWCSQFCSYCIVPFSRWMEKNFDKNKILEEVRHYIKMWVEEITLLGQIVNKHPDFVDILKEILDMDWLRRLRYTSPYPNFYSNDLIELHNHPKLCPHIHIPVQSWSDKILKSMHRWYTCEIFKWFVDKIRKLPIDINITTDIIVWFCDETIEDFEKTLELLDYCKFGMIYIGKYSVRPWTSAHKNLIDNIDKSEKERRRHILNDKFLTIAKEENKKEIWNTKTCMISKFDKKKKNLIWYTENMKNITINIENSKYEKDWNALVWQFLKSKIISTDYNMIFGDIC